MNHRLLRRYLIGASAVTAVLSAVPASAQSYQYIFQHQFGGSATFHAVGPATGDSPDVQGDAQISQVDMPTGDVFIHFFKPSDVSDLQFSGDPSKFRIIAGANCTVGLQDVRHEIGEADGDPDDVSALDLQFFETLALAALQSNNLNNYIDNGSNNAKFTMTIGFERPLQDNDPGADEFGEILYFERGTGAGNSWVKMRAVDDSGNPLGPWLVVGPNETVQTTPETTVSNSTQKMGTTSIDVSRLGVSQLQYLQVSNDVADEPAYTGGGDLQPDFKVMAVITSTEQLAEVIYD